MTDSTSEEVGLIVCRLHEVVQKHGPGWERLIDAAGWRFGSWLLHPLHRNWDLIQGIEHLLKEHERPADETGDGAVL